jgi:hypothetical protein
MSAPLCAAAPVAAQTKKAMIDERMACIAREPDCMKAL